MKVLFATAAALLLAAPAVAQVRDSRGVPVTNAEPNVPEGVNQTVNVPPGAQVVFSPPPFQTRPATMTYPPCQRGQTDRCTQTYERGRSPG
jgi:hypothetical protein